MRCDCGAIGCLEAYASSSGMRGLLQQHLGVAATESLPARFLDAGGDFSVRRMTALARQRDPDAIAVFDRAGCYLGIAIASYLNIFNPEMIVLGGGVACAPSG